MELNVRSVVVKLFVVEFAQVQFGCFDEFVDRGKFLFLGKGHVEVFAEPVEIGFAFQFDFGAVLVFLLGVDHLQIRRELRN